MYGNKWKMFFLELSFIGWEMLSVLTCGLGFLWVQPYMNAAKTNFYRDLINDDDETVTEGEAQEAVVIVE